jgi:hypothetical protein
MTREKFTAGTIQMADGTTRSARRNGENVEFFTFGNANNTMGHSWRKASAKQAKTFKED